MMKQSENKRRGERIRAFAAGALALVLLLPVLLLTVSCDRGPGEETTAGGGTENTGSPDMTTDPGGTDMTALLEEGSVYRIENPAWYALSGDEFGAKENAEVLTDATNDDLNQLWKVHTVDGGILLENMSAGLYLSVKGDAASDGALLSLRYRDEKHAQVWAVSPVEGKDSAFLLQNVMTGGFASGKEAEGTGSAIQKLGKEEATVWTFKKMAGADVQLPRVLILSGDYRSATSTPEVRKVDGVYYSYNMTGAITIKRSNDLKNWIKVGTLFSARPSWLKQETGSESIWAPGCYLVGGMLRCYYAVSSSGSQNSAIGMAYSVANKPTVGWKDGGMVIASKDGDPYNCIDPNIFVEDDGSTYLIFGSAWTGIYMRKINPETGLLDETEPTLWHLAQSSEKMEAPYLIKKDGYYYLFLAMGYLNDEKKAKTMPYRWAVGRSESLFGPYVDKNGKPLLEGNTSALTENKAGIQGVAHAQCFLDDDGTYYMVAESWEDRSVSKTPVVLHISSIVWNEQGWPVTALAKDLLKELAGKK